MGWKANLLLCTPFAHACVAVFILNCKVPMGPKLAQRLYPSEIQRSLDVCPVVVNAQMLKLV